MLEPTPGGTPPAEPPSPSDPDPMNRAPLPGRTPSRSATDPSRPTPGAGGQRGVRPDHGRVGLYTPEERARRDASPWTLVQGVLAPLQFVVMIGSAVLLVRFLVTGAGATAAEVSVVLKTALLYLIMVTGSIWEREVFGKWLFAPAFFWEDVVSMGVIALHTAYLVALFGALLAPAPLAWLALLAYAAYAVNAIQFVLKLRAARLQEREGRAHFPGAAAPPAPPRSPTPGEAAA